MDLSFVKTIIQQNSNLENLSKIKFDFNNLAKNDYSQKLNLMQLSNLLRRPVITYNEHVAFANFIGVNKFTYKSIKTNKTKSYIRIGTSKNFQTEKD